MATVWMIVTFLGLAVLGVPVCRPAQHESTGLGAGLLAGLATGVWSGLDEIAALRVEQRRFAVQMDATTRQAHLAQWHAAVSRARSAGAALVPDSSSVR